MSEVAQSSPVKPIAGYFGGQPDPDPIPEVGPAPPRKFLETNRWDRICGSTPPALNY